MDNLKTPNLEQNNSKKILSIDIGIVNLGYVFAELSETVKVLECNRVNIMNMKHNKVSRCQCTLHHDSCIPDYIDHFVQEHYQLFESADTILIERQPVLGLTNVSDLLFIKFRDKIKLVSPNTIHKFFKMTKCDYELRKIESNAIAEKYLETFYSYQNNERKHDISDAMLMILYFFETTKKVQPVSKICKVGLNNFNSLTPMGVALDIMDIEKFRFIKPSCVKNDTQLRCF